MNLEEYKKHFDKSSSPGWDAIQLTLDSHYKRKEEAHYAAKPSTQVGGQGPEGISLYVNANYIHYISFGFSSLYYDESLVESEYSGYGFELTFKLRRESEHNVMELPKWPISVMRNLYNYVLNSGKWFEPMQAIPIQDRPINADLTLEESIVTGLAFVEDPLLGTIETPHGKVQFLQMFGITREEAKLISKNSNNLEDILNKQLSINPELITDMKRR